MTEDLYKSNVLSNASKDPVYLKLSDESDSDQEIDNSVFGNLIRTENEIASCNSSNMSALSNDKFVDNDNLHNNDIIFKEKLLLGKSTHQPNESTVNMGYGRYLQ